MPKLETVPDFREVMDTDKLSTFSQLIERKLSLKAEMTELEEEKSSIDALITEILTDAGTPKVLYGETPVSICQGSRSTLSKERLLERGVAATVIADCTKVTSYSYVLVGKERS